MKKLIPKKQDGGWIKWLGQEGVPALRNLKDYVSLEEPEYGPYDLPEIEVHGNVWPRIPEYSLEDWNKLVENIVLNDPNISPKKAKEYIWALNNLDYYNPQYERDTMTPAGKGPWVADLDTWTYVYGYLPSDNPKYGGSGEQITDATFDNPSWNGYTTFKTNRYRPDDSYYKENLYDMLNTLVKYKNVIPKKIK